MSNFLERVKQHFLYDQSDDKALDDHLREAKELESEFLIDNMPERQDPLAQNKQIAQATPEMLRRQDEGVPESIAKPGSSDVGSQIKEGQKEALGEDRFDEFDAVRGVVYGGVKIGVNTINGLRGLKEAYEASFGGSYNNETYKVDLDADDYVDAPETNAGRLTAVLSQYIAPFVALGAAPIAMGGQIAGASVLNAAIMDPEDEALGDIINEYYELQGPIAEFLSSEDDTDGEKRLRFALESLAIDSAVAVGFIKVMKLIKGRGVDKAIQLGEKVGEVTPADRLDEVVQQADEFGAADQIDEKAFDVSKSNDQIDTNISVLEHLRKLEKSGQSEDIISDVTKYFIEKGGDDISDLHHVVSDSDELDKLVDDFFRETGIDPENAEKGLTSEFKINQILMDQKSKKANTLSKANQSVDEVAQRVSEKIDELRATEREKWFVETDAPIHIDPKDFGKASNVDELFDSIKINPKIWSDDASEAIAQLIEKNPETINKWRDLSPEGQSNVLSDAEAELALESDEFVKELTSRKIGDPTNVVIHKSLGFMTNFLEHRVGKIAEASLADPDNQFLNESYKQMNALYQHFVNRFYGSASTAAKALESNKHLKGKFPQLGNMREQEIANKLFKLKGGLPSEQEMKNLWATRNKQRKNNPDLVEPLSMMQAIGHTAKATGRLMEEIVFNNWLSGVPTHIVNFVSTGASNVDYLLRQGVESAWSIAEQNLFPSKKFGVDYIQKGETTIKMKAYAHAWRRMFTTIKNGELDIPIQQNKWALRERGGAVRQRAFHSDSFKFRTDNRLLQTLGASLMSNSVTKKAILGLEKGFNAMGAVQNIPTTALVYADAMMRHPIRTAELSALAHRRAIQGGLTYKSKEYAKYVERFIQSPTSDVMEIMNKKSRQVTFMEDPDELFKFFSGQRGAAAPVVELINTVPAARLMAPFFRINASLIDATIQRTPGINFLMDAKTRDAWAAGGARRAEVVSKTAVGATLIGLGSTIMLMDDESDGLGPTLLGRGSSDKKTRRAIKKSGKDFQEYSIKIGDTRYRFDTFDVHGSILKGVADVGAVIGQLDEEEADGLWTAAGLFIAQLYTPETLTGTLTDVMELLDPDSEKSFNERIITRIGTSAVPLSFTSFFKSIRKEVDPFERDVSVSEKGLNWDLFWNEMKNIYPGVSEALEPKLNIFGDPIKYPAGFGPDIISPFHTEKQESGPLYNELRRLFLHSAVKQEIDGDFSISMPDRYYRKQHKTDGGIVTIPYKLGANEYRKLVQYSAGIGINELNNKLVGSQIAFAKDELNEFDLKKYGGNWPTLKEKLTDIVSNGYPELVNNGRPLTDANKREVLYKQVRRYRDRGRKLLMMTDENLSSDIEQKYIKRLDKQEKKRQLGIGR